MEATPTSEEFRGKTIEAAIATGLAALGLARDQVEIEVVHPGSRGVLGIGAEDARVRLTRRVAPAAATKIPEYHEEDSGRERTPRHSAPVAAPAAPARRAPKATAEQREEATLTAPDEQIAEKARTLLLDLLAHIGLQAQVRTTWEHEPDQPGSPPALLLDIVGGDLGILIGRRGETLAALQYMLRLMLNQATGQWVNVVVDVEEYKARRERNLQQLALRMAERAAATRRTVRMEPMPPSERRVIHIALRNHPGVTTVSEGEGDARRVTIVPKKQGGR
ncbi:MAG: protein jag [Anaerolineae bacterium]|nr:protein jag [Anaerolineae bacterium]